MPGGRQNCTNGFRIIGFVHILTKKKQCQPGVNPEEKSGEHCSQ